MNTFSTWKKGFCKREKTHLTSGTIHCHKFCLSVICLGEKKLVCLSDIDFIFSGILQMMMMMENREVLMTVKMDLVIVSSPQEMNHLWRCM